MTVRLCTSTRDVRGLGIDLRHRDGQILVQPDAQLLRREPAFPLSAPVVWLSSNASNEDRIRRKGFGSQCALQSIAGMIRRIKECVDLCDRHSLVRLSHLTISSPAPTLPSCKTRK